MSLNSQCPLFLSTIKNSQYLRMNSAGTAIEGSGLATLNGDLEYQIPAAADQASIEAAMALASNGTLFIPPGGYAITADLTIPSDVHTIISKGAVLTIATGKTLTINGPFEAGTYQCFSGAGTVTGLNRTLPEWFGAKGDGTTDDSVAITSAYNSLATKGVLLGNPGATYILDTELIITKEVTLDGQGATIKLPDNSNLFNDSTNIYARCLIHIRESNVEIKNWKFDGNSPNNYYETGGIKYYVYNASPLLYHVGALIHAGFYGTSATKNLYNIKIHHNTVKDAPWCFVDSRMQGGTTYQNYGLNVSDNYILHGQGPQIAFYQTTNAVASNNTFVNPYDFTIQTYYENYSTLINGNTTYFNSTEIDFNEVDPLNKTGTTALWSGQMRIGKGNESRNYGTVVTGNTFYGGFILITAGTVGALIEGNNIYKSEDVGIYHQQDYTALGDGTSQYDVTDRGSNVFRYTYDGTGTDPAITSANPPIGARVYFYGGTFATANGGYQDVIASGANYFEVYNAGGVVESNKVSAIRWVVGSGTVIKNNNIYQCQYAGLYLGGSYFPVEVFGNNLYGNHISTSNYGGRTVRANIVVVSPFYDLKGNFARQFNGAPLYGVHIITGTTIYNYIGGSTTSTDLINIQNNDLVGSGRTADFYDPDGNHRGNVNFIPAEAAVAHRNFDLSGAKGTLKMWTYQNDAIADDGAVDLPDATSGFVFVSCNAESGMWAVQNDGTVTKIAGSTNTDAADTDAKLDVFDQGTNGRVRNRLGAPGEIRIIYFYN